ncbi:DUF3572 family protein [Microvirga aerophila]|uniref:DUF3572 family protein n=1 Tax=Microvirga aerophila TaxID=670291 RepID=UPI000DEF0FED
MEKVFETDKTQGLGLSAQEEGLGIGRGLAPIPPNSNQPALARLTHAVDRIIQFLNVTGLQPETIRASATSSHFLLGVLEYVSNFCSVDVRNVFWWRLNRIGIAKTRRSAVPRFCSLYLTCRAANAIPPDDLFSKAVDPLPDDGSAPLAFDATGRICVEVTLIGVFSPAITAILIFTVGNLGPGYAPAEQCCHGDQGSSGACPFGPPQHGSLPVQWRR